jgi:hypothetical protein
MKRELDLYKSYYYKYIEFMKNRRKNNLSTTGSRLTPLSPLSIVTNIAKPEGSSRQKHLELKAMIQSTRESKVLQRAKITA